MKGIEVKQVTMNFDHQTVLDGIGLTIEPNKIYGLLGRNGAGKSTLLSLLVDRMVPNSGSIQLDDENIRDQDEKLSQLFLMSEANLYPKWMKVNDIFKWTSRLYGDLDEELLQELCLKFSVNKNAIFNKLSTGYKTIVKLIVALSVPAEYIFLDEPVLGLDAPHREIFYQALVETYSNHPRTFVIATHLIEEFSNLVEQVLIIDRGRLIIDDDIESVLKHAYLISGPADEVDQYCEGLNVIGSDHLARIKANYVYGPLEERPIPDVVNIDKMDLQTLFVNLTNGGDQHE